VEDRLCSQRPESAATAATNPLASHVDRQRSERTNENKRVVAAEDFKESLWTVPLAATN